MDHKIYEINDLSNQLVNNILRTGITVTMFDSQQLSRNYLYDHRQDPANLFNKLEKGVYIQGCYYVVTDDKDNFIASAGWHHYNDSTALALTRMLVHPQYRTQYIIGNHVLPLILDSTKNYNKIWITSNEYNQSIYKYFERIHNNKSGTLFSNWPVLYKKFKPIGQHKVNNVLQWVAEHKNK